MRKVPTAQDSLDESFVADGFVAMLNQPSIDDPLSFVEGHSDSLDFSEVSLDDTADNSQVLEQDSAKGPRQVDATCEEGSEAFLVASSSDQKIDFQSVLQSASQSLTSKPIRNVWENGVWGCIFGNDSLMQAWNSTGFQFYRPQQTLGIPASSDVESQPTSKKMVKISEDYHDVVKFKSDATWQEQCESGWQETIKLWLTMVVRWDHRVHLVKLIANARDDSEACEILSDIFKGRSHKTLRKRALAIGRICNFLDDEFKPPFPCCEQDFYTFMKEDQKGGAPASRLAGYVQAVNFCVHVMGVDELSECENSKRCKGAAKQDVPREVRQAAPLKVADVEKIHSILHTDNGWNAMFCGAILMAIYSRARWGDLMRCESIIFDPDMDGSIHYVEARVGRHKTRHSQQHRHQFLPMVAPSLGVVVTPWAERWKEIIELLNIKLPPEGCIMPAPDQFGNPCARPLESCEAGAWLRKLLRGKMEIDPCERISSHSCKATLLSYAAKRGIDVADRLQLGYHTGQFRMSMVYSRDGASASLLILEKLLGEIRQKTFLPDVTRSGRIVKTSPSDSAEKRKEVQVKIESEVVEVASSGSEDVLDGTDDSTSSSSDGNEEEVKQPPMFTPPAAPQGYVMYQHRKLRTLHLMPNHREKIFMCGRPKGLLHTSEGLNPRYDTPICFRCFTNAKQT